MKKIYDFNTVLRFSIGGGSESEIKVNVEYVLTPGTDSDPAEVEIHRIKFRYEDHNGRFYWVDLPDWMLEYIVANEVFRDELIQKTKE